MPLSNRSNKAKLAILVSRFPFPLEKGDKLRAYYQIKDLSQSFEIHLICLSDSAVSLENRKELEQFCQTITIHTLKKWEIALSLFRAIFTQKPFQVAYFYQFRIHQKIKAQIAQNQFDYLYSQLVRTTEYIKDEHACPKTLDYMDALSKGMERRAEDAKFIKKWIFSMESKRLKLYEKQIFDYFEHHTIITSQDRNAIFHPEKNAIKCIANGVSSAFFEEKQTEKTVDLLFTGNMSYAPNIHAGKYIATEILPKLKTKFPNIQCLLSGASPVQEIRSLTSPNLKIGGWIEDMRDSYWKSKIFIAPLFLGSGLQNKLLEAMAMGIPCITTDLANNALQAKHQEEILIANSSEEFVLWIEKLLSDQMLYQRISSNGKSFIAANFKWDVQNKKLAEVIGA